MVPWAMDPASGLGRDGTRSTQRVRSRCATEFLYPTGSNVPAGAGTDGTPRFLRGFVLSNTEGSSRILCGSVPRPFGGSFRRTRDVRFRSANSERISREIETIFREHNRGAEGQVVIDNEYLRVVAHKARLVRPFRSAQTNVVSTNPQVVRLLSGCGQKYGRAHGQRAGPVA